MNAQDYLMKKAYDKSVSTTKINFAIITISLCVLAFNGGRVFEYYQDFDYRQKVENYKQMEEAIEDLTATRDMPPAKGTK